VCRGGGASRINKGGAPLLAPPLRIVWLVEGAWVGAFSLGDVEGVGAFSWARGLGQTTSFSPQQRA